MYNRKRSQTQEECHLSGRTGMQAMTGSDAYMFNVNIIEMR